MERRDTERSARESRWARCSVAVVTEKGPDYVKYVRMLEEGVRVGRRPAVKVITARDLFTQIAASPLTALVSILDRLTDDEARREATRYQEIKSCGRSAGKKAAKEAEIHDEPLCGPSLYIVLTGFKDAEVVFQLLRMGAPVHAVVAIGSTSQTTIKSKSDPSKKKRRLGLWADFLERRQEVGDLLSDTLTLEIDKEDMLPGEEDLKPKESRSFVVDYVCRRLYDLQNERRRYVDLIRNTELQTVQVVEARKSLSSLRRYIDLMNDLPSEARTVEYVIHCLVSQVELDQEPEMFQSAHERPTEDTFLIQYKNSRQFDMKARPNIYNKLQNGYAVCLEGSPCPRLWRYFPQTDRIADAKSRSHFQKVSAHFCGTKSPLAEVLLHKRIFNRMILTTVNAINLEPLKFDSFRAQCGCIDDISTNSETFLIGEDDVISEESSRIAKFVKKNQEDLLQLQQFLSFSELDDLTVPLHEVIANYNIAEIFSKETCLSLLDSYFHRYESVDFVHFSGTDSLLLVFHSNEKDDDISHLTRSALLLTSLRFVDYYDVVSKLYPYNVWLGARRDEIDRENQDLLKEFKAVKVSEDEERCCLKKLRLYGLWEREEGETYQTHAPHPSRAHSPPGLGFFIAYDMSSRGLLDCAEKRSTYLTKSGSKLIAKVYNTFGKSYCLFCFTHKHFEVMRQFCVNDCDEESHQETPITIQTWDGIRIFFDCVEVSKSPANSELNLKSIKSRKSNVPMPRKRSIASRRKSDRKSFRKLLAERMTSNEYWPLENVADPTVTLPNGLHVSLYRVDDRIVGVKQSYATETKIKGKPIGEKYRIYLKNGTVMAFGNDGQITVLYSNTTRTVIKRIVPERDVGWCCENSAEEERYWIVGEHRVLTWLGVEKRFLYGHCREVASDFTLRTAVGSAGELFTLRSDGTKSYLNSDGELTVRFSDGTCITSTPQESGVTDEPWIGVEGWIRVDLQVLVEGPKLYLPTLLTDNRCVVTLPENRQLIYDESFRFSAPSFHINMDRNSGDSVEINCQKEMLNVYFSTTLFNCACKLNEGTVDTLVDDRGEIVHVPSDSQNLLDKSRHSPNRNDSFFVLPKTSQRDFKLFCLRRDLSGYELVANDNRELAGPTFKKGVVNINYTSLPLSVISTDVLPIMLSEATAYTRPDLSTVVDIPRSRLSGVVPRDVVWLTDVDDLTHEGCVPAPRHPPPQRRRVVVTRKRIDLTLHDDLEKHLDTALSDYIDYKKHIYAEILKNSLRQVSAAQILNVQQ